MHRYQIGDCSFALREPFDFSFLDEYGRVFAVFDQQDSGNLCFGVEGPEGRLFVKLAGAATERGPAACDMAIRRMRATVPVYQDLRHPALIGLTKHCPVPGGYLTLFEWFDGVCMGKQYGAFDRFLALSVHEKLDIYRTILDFHHHVNRRGYVAVDFYDGCLLYDFESRELRICDIEMYGKMPMVNTMGRMWGSTRYMSPEEFALGARLNERTNVFTMGATAFQLFGGGLDRAPELWQAGDTAYAVALRAVSPRPEDRPASIGAYREDWEQALTGVDAPFSVREERT